MGAWWPGAACMGDPVVPDVCTEAPPRYGARRSLCSTTFPPSGRKLQPVDHLPQLLQNLAKAYPWAVQLRATALLPLWIVNPHQFACLKVPPFFSHIVMTFLPRSRPKLLFPGKSMRRLEAILKLTGVLPTRGQSQGVRRVTKRQLCRGAKLPPQHEKGWCAGCGLLNR